MGAMADPLKKAFYIGLGATVISAERVKGALDGWMCKRQKKRQERKMRYEQWLNRANERRQKLETSFRRLAKTCSRQTIQSLGLVSRDEFDALKRELEEARKNAAKAPSSSRSVKTSASANISKATKRSTKASAAGKKAPSSSPRNTSVKRSSSPKRR